MHNVHRLWD